MRESGKLESAEAWTTGWTTFDTTKNSLDFSRHTAGKVTNIHFVHRSTAASGTSQACGEFTTGGVVSDALLAGGMRLPRKSTQKSGIYDLIYTLSRLSDKDDKIYPHKKFIDICRLNAFGFNTLQCRAHGKTCQTRACRERDERCRFWKGKATSLASQKHKTHGRRNRLIPMS